MAFLGVTATETGLAPRGGAPGTLAERLAPALGRLAPDALVVVMVHGYKFDPLHPDKDPETTLFAPDEAASGGWIRGLGLDRDEPGAGLGLGFGWPAAEAHLPSLLAEGRTGFARVYDRAGRIGMRLAELIATVQALAPGREVDVIAHSLGARVALAALPHLERAPGRLILLGAAEFDSRAAEFLAAAPGGGPAVYNITARANDFYDAMFETFAPRRSWHERALGLGLSGARPGWIDIQIDRPDMADWLTGRGVTIAPAHARFCHWSFYTRPGAFTLYGAILRRHAGWDVATLKGEPCLAGQEPRWSRLPLPRRTPRRANSAPEPMLGIGLEGA